MVPHVNNNGENYLKTTAETAHIDRGIIGTNLCIKQGGKAHKDDVSFTVLCIGMKGPLGRGMTSSEKQSKDLKIYQLSTKVPCEVPRDVGRNQIYVEPGIHLGNFILI